MKSQKRLYLILVAAVFVAACLISSCNDDPGKRPSLSYDPSKPVEVLSFSPDSGKIRTKVILEGHNFGSDPEKVRVYFNDKRAAVVGSSGDKMYVITPRIAADLDCDVSVAVGTDSVVFPQKFRYKMTVSVSTVVGNGTSVTVPGPLETATISPWMLDVDGGGNIFVATDPSFAGNQSGVFRVNEEENVMELIAVTAGPNDYANRTYGMAADKTTGKIYTTIGEALLSYVIMDPAESWSPRIKNFRWVENPDYPVASYPTGNIGGKYVGYNRFDGYLYTRYPNGYLIRIDPRTGTGMILYITPLGSESGVSETQSYDFDPKDPDWCYVGGNSASGLYRFNVKDAPNTWERLNEPLMPGHRDGPIEQALFRNVWGVRFDSDGLLYICDYNNHCIRRYNTETRIVETMLGIPSTPGFKDGGPEEAMFNLPSYLGIDNDGNVYVADRNNRRVRKLAIE